jgi:two-component system, OmpR family, sensor histidine kinase KdpD
LKVFDVRWPGLLVWLASWVLLWICADVLNLGNLALLLVLASALGGMWLSAGASLLMSLLSVIAFNWFFVPSRYTFNVNLFQDALLLVTMLGVSATVSYLMARLRSVAESESQHAKASQQLRDLGEQFREINDLQEQGELLQSVLQTQVNAVVSVMLLPEAAMVQADLDPLLIGSPQPHDMQGLWACVHQSVNLGPGTGRDENQDTLFLPLRGRARALGAVAICRSANVQLSPAMIRNMQQMCDLLGVSIERAHTLHSAQKAREDAQHQQLRNTLLTSISHDYRTPLANLMGAASAIESQSNRLSVDQIKTLACTVLTEAQHLNRMTSNTLQLARLDMPNTKVHKDWESLQEILGSVLSKTRIRHPQRMIHVHLSERLPLILCDAIMLVQLFDNLVENAIKYSPPHSSVSLHAHIQQDQLEVRVMDHGPGIAAHLKEQAFKPFVRLQNDTMPADASDQSQLRRGVGVGLAVCKAIAKVHNAGITLEDTLPHGLTVLVCFPIPAQPQFLTSPLDP